jgi:hypothetical protein
VRRRSIAPLAYALGGACVLAFGCFGSGPQLIDTSDAIDASSIDLNDAAGLPKSDVDLGDPFALEAVQPSHGAYTGGTRVVLGGRGFNSHLHVYIGATEVPTGVLASDPTRAAVDTPPGKPGIVDVRIFDDQTKKQRILTGGFQYDSFIVEPSSGATSGGTRVRLTNGDATKAPWGPTPKIAIGGVQCTGVGNYITAPDAESIECTTPPGAQGSRDVAVTPGSGNTLSVRDAFTYSDSPDGFRGGLTGGVLSGRLHVVAMDSLTGTPVANAYVAVGVTSPIIQQTAQTGVTEFNGITGTTATVTITAKCHQPITFMDVPVDTVTAYLPPVLDPSCASGDPPSSGPPPGLFGGQVEGQLVFPGQGEFQRAGWSTVPTPTKPTERRAAYVFEAATSPNFAFQLPSAAEAITPETAGSTGYSYTTVVFPGNATVYAVAGLEDRSESPPVFLPYSMGVVRGITVPAQTRVTGVDIKMDILFDHEVNIAFGNDVPGPEARGPDRIQGNYALTLGSAGYALLPMATRMAPLPKPATMPFIGVPSLDHAIAGEQYVLGAAVATGPMLQRPASVVSRVRTTEANVPFTLGGFLGIPVLGQPGAGAWNGTHVQFSGVTGVPSLTMVTVTSGGGLVQWIIVAPGAATSFDVLDPNSIPSPDSLGLVRGEVVTSVYVAYIDQFSYGKLRYGQLQQAAWNAWASDFLGGSY